MRIKCKAMCVFAHEGMILVQKEVDAYTGSTYYRPLGGSIEFGEKSEETLIREINEEISADITDLRQLGVLENIFWYEGNRCHQIVFIYDARFKDIQLYGRDTINGQEADGSEIIGMWKRMEYFDEERRLVPEGLIDLMAKSAEKKGIK